jgi:photosystem II stability/assembly factor-like uncharacterized protein
MVLAFGASYGASGQDWMETSAPRNAWRTIVLSADGRKMAAAADHYSGDGLVYTSADSGTTWVAMNAPTSRWDAISASADGMKLAASGNGNVYTSSDFGTNWFLRTNISFQSLVLSADGTRIVGASAFNVYTSTNSGEFWSLSSGMGSCIGSSADGVKLVSAYFAYPGHIEGGIFTSTNAGNTWNPTSAPLDLTTGWNSLASSADGMKLAATIGYTSWPTGPGPIYTSSNGGETWIVSGSPTSHWFSVGSSADGTKLVAAGDSGLFTSTNSGATWITNGPPGNNRTFVASSADGNTLAAVVEGGGIYIFYSTPTPTLRITILDTNVILSWTVPSIEFAVQQKPDLNSPNWTTVTNNPKLNLTNLENEVVVSPTKMNIFYRLRH